MGIASPKALGQFRKNTIIKVKKTDNFRFKKNVIADEWQKAKWIQLSQIKGTQTQGYYTKVKVLYSNTGLYILFECGDRVLTATFHSDFKKLWTQDVIEVFLWPDQRTPVYFEYELSPLNYELMLLVSAKRDDRAKWIPFQYHSSNNQTRHKILVKRGKKKRDNTIKKWIAQIYIPYKLLNPLNNISPKSGTKWRANFYRIDYGRKNIKWWAWQSVSKSFHEYKKFGMLVFR